ncbi:DNA polymerase III subunit beta [Candidatus Parcubacteria bacterium]|nr:DNA polymerase III subunit beta [Candidatus Parcubacteria bacterium]
MKISTLQENLKTGVYIVSHIAGKNVNLPILSNVLIKASKDGINLITTDLEMGIISKIRGKVETEGKYTVNAKVLSDYVSLLPNQKINLEKKDNILTVCSENYKTSIKGQEAEDYPLIPKIDKNIYFKLNIEEFKKALSQVIFSVSISDTRIELTGVLFSFSKNGLTLASTDSFRLSEKKVKVTTNIETEDEIKVVIPSKTLQEVIRILSTIREGEINRDENEIVFYISENQVLFTVKDTELISKLIDGQYPDYTQIIPLENKTVAIINKKEFVRAIKASSIFSKSGVNDVNLDFPLGKNKIIISSTSSLTGENITELDAKVDGDDNGVVVNYKYLLDGLNNIEGDSVRMEIVNNNTPCILKSEKDDNYLYLIMPIKQ